MNHVQNANFLAFLNILLNFLVDREKNQSSKQKRVHTTYKIDILQQKFLGLNLGSEVRKMSLTGRSDPSVRPQ